MSDAAWNFATLIVTAIVAPSVMWYLNQKQTAKITAGQEQLKRDVTEDAAFRAAEVKTELAVAKIELKQDNAEVAANVAAKIEAVHETAVETKKIANGDRAAKEAEIRRLRASMRNKGLDPDEK